jgi:5-methylcytosine-specific restriction endonuclease McrA
VAVVVADGKENMKEIDEMVGKRFGRLIVQSKAPSKISKGKKKNAVRAMVTVSCECGSPGCRQIFDTRRDHLLAGKVNSCGQEYRHKTIRGPRKYPNPVMGFWFGSYKNAAKKRGLSFTINPAQLLTIALHPCHYCGQKPSEVKAKSGRHIHHFSMNGLDRVDNTRGYELDNLVSCCKDCNWSKGEKSVEDFLSHIRRIAMHQGWITE